MAIQIGQEVSPMGFDPNLFQDYEDTCAIRSQEIVMRDFGIQIPQDELVDYAEQQGWYDNGTPMDCVGNLLDVVHIETNRFENANGDDLFRELSQGHRVIVGVDAHEIWRDGGPIGNWIADHVKDANHALIVTSLNVDIDDPSKTTVMLTDPGSGEIIECPYSRFAHAWSDSDGFMIATKDAAPYQYNPETHNMELSNFATEFSLSEFPFQNEFTTIPVPENYQAFYNSNCLAQVTDDWQDSDDIIAYHRNFEDSADWYMASGNEDIAMPFGEEDNILGQEPLDLDLSTLSPLDSPLSMNDLNTDDGTVFDDGSSLKFPSSMDNSNVDEGTTFDDEMISMDL